MGLNPRLQKNENIRNQKPVSSPITLSTNPFCASLYGYTSIYTATFDAELIYTQINSPPLLQYNFLISLFVSQLNNSVLPF